MKNLRRLLWVIALFPWFDFLIRQTLPSFVASTWDELLLLAVLGLLFIYKWEECRRGELNTQSYLHGNMLFHLLCCCFHCSHVVSGVSIMLRVVFQPVFCWAMFLMMMRNQTFFCG